MHPTRRILYRSLTALATAGLLLSSFASDAQITLKKKKGKRPAFDVDDNTIAVGLGIGALYSYTNANFLPAFTAYADHGLIGHVGPGTIGIGGTTGYLYARNDLGYGLGRETWSELVFGLRGTYHLTLLKEKNNKFDPYGGLTLGARFHNYQSNYHGVSESYVYFYPALFVGAKYNFTEKFGVWAEAGYDITFLRLGVAYNY